MRAGASHRRLGPNPGPGTDYLRVLAAGTARPLRRRQRYLSGAASSGADLDITAALNEEADFCADVLHPVTRSDAFVLFRGHRRPGRSPGGIGRFLRPRLCGTWRRIFTGSRPSCDVAALRRLRRRRKSTTWPPFRSAVPTGPTSNPLKSEAPHKFGPPTSILQLHIPTATARGTLASLTREIERLSERVENGRPSSPPTKLLWGRTRWPAPAGGARQPSMSRSAFWQERDILPRTAHRLRG